LSREKQMDKGLAPLGVSTYKRLEHLKRCVESLKRNALATQTDVYFFSDAPKSGDEEAVAELRQYLKTISGFKTVHVVEREYNNRVTNNRSGMRLLLDKYDRIIFLEEDVVVAPKFLSYMNHALDKYRDNPRIFSITGYCPPIQLPDSYEHSVFFLRRFNAWGFGIWKDRFEKIDYIDREAYLSLIDNRTTLKDFIENGGEDILGMLRLDTEGAMDALDVKAMYAQFINNQYTVYPRQSLTRNIGMDGSGTHCPRNNKFDVTLWENVEYFDLPEFHVDQQILKSHRRFRKPRPRVQWSERIKIFLSRCHNR